jgi:hypothetical protein
MRARIIVAAALTVVVGAATAAGAVGAPTTRSTPKNCGKLAAAGRSWSVASVALPCAQAKSIVSRLASRANGAFFRAVVSGFSCLGGAKAGQHGLTCVSRDGKKSVYAARAG